MFHNFSDEARHFRIVPGEAISELGEECLKSIPRIGIQAVADRDFPWLGNCPDVNHCQGVLCLEFRSSSGDGIHQLAPVLVLVSYFYGLG